MSAGRLVLAHERPTHLSMITRALFVRLEARTGREQDVENFLRSALNISILRAAHRSGSRCASDPPPSASSTRSPTRTPARPTSRAQWQPP